MEKTIKQASIFKEELTEILIDGEDTVPVSDIDQFKCHAGGAFHGIHISASWTETAVATEGNKLQFATFGTAVHCPAISRVTTMNHLLDVLDDSVARVKGVNHFFIVIGKDFLEDIHMISMREMKEKENPDSPHE